LPRVFVVPGAVNGDDITAVDFRRAVLLEESPGEMPAATEPGYWTVSVENYQPNCVSIAATGTTPGWLILTDIWYPGWECMVDGKETRVYRGDFLFRTVPLAAGRHELVFRFKPKSYLHGRTISLAALAAVLGIAFVGLCAVNLKALKRASECSK
jgi:hypothetical protein